MALMLSLPGERAVRHIPKEEFTAMPEPFPRKDCEAGHLRRKPGTATKMQTLVSEAWGYDESIVSADYLWS